MSFKCCLVIRTIAGTLDNRFTNFRHFAIYPNFSIFLLLLLFLFGRATVKLKCNVSGKTIGGYLKYQYPLQWAFFSYVITGYGPKQLLSGCYRSRNHKSRADAHHQNYLSSNGIRQKLPKPSFKSYVNNISLCQACFLKLKFPCLKFSKFLSTPFKRR